MRAAMPWADPESESATSPGSGRATNLPGSSLAAVSRNHGVDPQQVAMALTNAANQRIDTAQGAGRITADQASRMKQRVTEMIQRFMDRQLPVRPNR